MVDRLAMPSELVLGGWEADCVKVIAYDHRWHGYGVLWVVTEQPDRTSHLLFVREFPLTKVQVYPNSLRISFRV